MTYDEYKCQLSVWADQLAKTTTLAYHKPESNYWQEQMEYALEKVLDLVTEYNMQKGRE